MQQQQTENIDPHEIEKFNSIAMRWWDKNSEFKPLHDINPVRVEYIINQCGDLRGKKILDVGCGGGILSEALAATGAQVTGIDMGETNIRIARLHLHESRLDIDYQHIPVEQLAQDKPAEYDIVTCLEMLEHVPDPKSIIDACMRLTRPGGDLFFSTLNRNPKAYLLGIIGAEYILNILPKGTHDYKKFIKPSELSQWLREADGQVEDIRGMKYNPFNGNCHLNSNIDINYLVHARAAT